MKPNFERIHTRAERSETQFRQKRELQCGEKVKLPKHIAREMADKHIGRAYRCKHCGMWHFSATESIDWRE